MLYKSILIILFTLFFNYSLNAQTNCDPIILNGSFTENNDGFNNKWKVNIEDSCYINYECVIFDRYGRKIWKNNDPINHWDGGFKTYSHFVGKEMYQFLITITEIDTVKVYTGSITILR
jgi:gliding motility-associated-like protein